MKRILILTGRYLPGHKDGGPLRTIANIVDALGDEYEFYIGCLDRDHGDTEPYDGIVKNEWNKVGKANVWYVEPGGFTNKLIMNLADGKDSIYLSSFYDDYGYKSLLLKRFGRIKTPVSLASMGVFSKGALAQRALKKRLFISFCKGIGLFNDITWSVTSEIEAKDLKRVLGNEIRYVIAEDLPRNIVPGRKKDNYCGPLRMAFLSRICAHKGLDIAIEAWKAVKEECYFSIYGPIQEEDYWKECQTMLSGVDNWIYKGDVDSEKVQEVLSSQDVLVLPTKSENFGHVIFEALSVGCIPVISPFTPWSIIKDKGAGYIVDNDACSIAACIESLYDKDLNDIKDRAVLLAKEKIENSYKNTGYRIIFNM